MIVCLRMIVHLGHASLALGVLDLYLCTLKIGNRISDYSFVLHLPDVHNSCKSWKYWQSPGI